MAINLAVRAVLTLAAEGLTRVIRSDSRLKFKDGPSSVDIEHRLFNSTESDEALSAAASAAYATMVSVATYTGAFELRKLHLVFSFAGGSPRGDDSRIVTFHHVKLVADSPDPNWVDADFLVVENAMNTLIEAIKPAIMSYLTVDEYRWYKAGPNISPPQEPVRIIDRNVVGTRTTGLMPPQVASTCTERTASRKAWGRTYWPFPFVIGAENLSATGRYPATSLGTIANALDAFYEACKTGNVPVVVYSPAKPERSPTASDPRYRTKGATLAAIGARALTVDTIQVDDVPDVIRSRRHDAPTLKVLRGIGS